jgi:hypothetical protein
MIRFRMYIALGLAPLAGSGCVTVNSPLFPCPGSPIVVDRGCPQVMREIISTPATATPPPPTSPGPFAPGVPEPTPTAHPDPVEMLPALTVPRLTPSTGGARRTVGICTQGVPYVR